MSAYLHIAYYRKCIVTENKKVTVYLFLPSWNTSEPCSNSHFYSGMDLSETKAEEQMYKYYFEDIRSEADQYLQCNHLHISHMNFRISREKSCFENLHPEIPVPHHWLWYHILSDTIRWLLKTHKVRWNESLMSFVFPTDIKKKCKLKRNVY